MAPNDSLEPTWPARVLSSARYRLWAGHGSGDPLVLLHNSGNSSEVWRPFLPEFATEYRVITIDLRGHGRSTNPSSRFTHRQAALDVLGVLDALGIGQVKDDWAQRLPPGLVELTERLLLASGSPGYGPRMMRVSKRPWMIRIYQIQDLMMPGQFEGLGHRKIFIQQQVEAAIEEGARQLLVLGAGLDTLCLRLAPQHTDLQFFEVDHPATSAAKARGVALEGQPANMTQIAADLAKHTVSNVLSEDGRWQSALRSVLVAEGLFQYLTDNEVRGLLRDAAACTSPTSR